MIDLIVKAIMSNIAQFTTLFDTETLPVDCTIQNNTITIAGLSGEYVLTGGVEGVASAGCINGLHNFVAGVATTNCFFGDTPTILSVVRHKVNAGYALKRELAIEMMLDTKVQNVLVAYWETTQNTKEDYTYSISGDNITKMEVNFGVMVKLQTAQMEALGGFDALDKVIANSVIETGNVDATLVRFNSVKDRFFAGNNYIIDVGFSYLEEMNINDIIKERLKAFDTTLDTLTT